MLQQQANTRTNQMAVISIATGVASWVLLPIIGAVVAVVTGHIARREIRQTGESGDGLAIIGLVLGYAHLLVALLIVGFILLFLFGALAFVIGSGGAHPPQ